PVARRDLDASPTRRSSDLQGTSHVPESWLPGWKQFLFDVTKVSTEASVLALLGAVTGAGSTSLWSFSLEDKKAAPFGDIQSTRPISAVFSPDGRWVAYSIHEQAGSGMGNPLGIDDAYIQHFPATGYRKPITRVKHGCNQH